MESIKSLVLYGTGFAGVGLLIGSYSPGFYGLLPIGLFIYAMAGVLIYFSFRPYWQINKSYVTGKMGGLETAINFGGEILARSIRLAIRLAMKYFLFVTKIFLKVVAFIMSGGKLS